MPRRLMWVEWDDDAELSSSHKNPGAYSPLTRDADGNLGHATLSDADEYDADLSHGWTPAFNDDDTSDSQGLTSEEISKLVETVTDVLVAAQPHVARWWRAQALPTIKSTGESVRGKLARAPKPERSNAATEAAMRSDAASEEPPRSMSADEARQRLLSALVARAFSDEQVQLLVRTRIEDANGETGFKSLLEEFTFQEIESQVSQMLAAKPDMADEFFHLFSSDRRQNVAQLPLGAQSRRERKGRPT